MTVHYRVSNSGALLTSTDSARERSQVSGAWFGAVVRPRTGRERRAGSIAANYRPYRVVFTPAGRSGQVEGERPEAAERPVVQPLDVGLGEREPREPPEERGDGHLGLDPRERRADAVVDAEAEGEVADVRAAEVEPLRIGELGRIMVRRADHQKDPIPFRDP